MMVKINTIKQFKNTSLQEYFSDDDDASDELLRNETEKKPASDDDDGKHKAQIDSG